MATVKDLLHTDLRTIGNTETLEQAARAFAGEVLGLLVVIENDRLVGVLSERDVVRSLGEGDDTGIDKAVQLMLDDEIRHLVVTRLGDPYGIVSARDLLRAQLEGA